MGYKADVCGNRNQFIIFNQASIQLEDWAKEL